MKVRYRHYRFSRYPQACSEEFLGRHGVAYHYQRGHQTLIDASGTPTKQRLTAWKPLPRGGYTICTIYDDDDNEIVQGVAECSPLDSFCYRIGRAIAKGRALKQVAK